MSEDGKKHPGVDFRDKLLGVLHYFEESTSDDSELMKHIAEGCSECNITLDEVDVMLNSFRLRLFDQDLDLSDNAPEDRDDDESDEEG